jgi:hypothetical protein
MAAKLARGFWHFFGLFKTKKKCQKARSQMAGIAVEHRPEGQKKLARRSQPEMAKGHAQILAVNMKHKKSS